jgi:uncharacterized protein involved in outer membrane biogenesis
MLDRRWLDDPRLARVRVRTLQVYRSGRARRLLLALGIMLVMFGLLGFLAAPPLLKSMLQKRLAVQLGRPVTIGAVHLNPYTLRLQLDRLHIGEPHTDAPFVDVDCVVINAAWSSLFRWAPVLDELTLQHPQVRLIRRGPGRFNISDLLQRFAGPSDTKAAPARFSLANISVHDGDVRLDDRVLKTSHRIDRLELGIPFLANLPAATNLFVKPLLAARIDGSTLRIAGQTKPFAGSRESVIDFQLDHLNLPRYLSYVPSKLPLTIAEGELSGKLELRFNADDNGAKLRLGGELLVDDLRVTSPGSTALLELKHGSAQLVDVEPLISRYRLGALALDGARLHFHRGADGHSNLDALLPADAGRSATPAEPATDLQIGVIEVAHGHLDYADAAADTHSPGVLTLQQISGSLHNLATGSAPPATVSMAAQLNGGGVGITGKLRLVQSRLDGEIALRRVALAPLQTLAMPQLQATLASGTLDADGRLQLSWGKLTNLHLEPARFNVSRLAVRHGDQLLPAVAWASMQVKMTAFDLATSNARISSVAVQGLALNAKRLRNSSLDLLALLEPGSPAPSGSSPSKGAGAWHWQIAQLTVDDGDLGYEDLRNDHPASIHLHIDHDRIDSLSGDMHQPLTVAMKGALEDGRYDLAGQITPQPLAASLHVAAQALDVAALQSLISVPLNVRIASALLSADGQFDYRDRADAPARIDYRGSATLGRVKVQDKLTGDDFLRWHSLAATGLRVHLGDGAPQADIGGLALSDFYARVIFNSTGRLNLQDVMGTEPGAAPVSVTRVEKSPAPAAPIAAATSPPAQLRIGQITLARGELNYTDNFIKPNYTANITGLTGSIGAFATLPGPPAALVLQGRLDDSAPVDISGTINPLTPMAFLDIKAKADGVELASLSPYSGRYAGYPITGGVLNVDVHYLLDERKLTADNHIFIEQLSLGDRIDAPGVSHLPVKLAVALLKNAQGQIDVHVPVSGSLDDPKFSMASVVWRALGNLIARAATSPFRLLASLAGDNQPDLGYVDFAPGSAVLDSTAQARLEKLVKLLEQRPALTLDITGRVDPALDDHGLRTVMVDNLIHQAKAADDGNASEASRLKLTPDEYQHYLERVYRHARFPKPKNLIGFTKSQPPEVMQQLLEANMAVDADALRHLAQQRAQSVHQWLHGKIEDKRLTLHPPVLDAEGIKDKGKTTRVDFGLH